MHVSANTKSQFNPLWMRFGCGICSVYLGVSYRFCRDCCCCVLLPSSLSPSLCHVLFHSRSCAMQCSSRLLQFVFQIKHAQVFHCRRQFATKNKHKHFECAVRTNTGTIVHYNNPKYCGHCCNCPVHVRMCACIRYVKSETKHKKRNFLCYF